MDDTNLVGRRLLHYDILGPLGKGGMGEVYRARDRKLGREVAIKVLAAERAPDPERFRAEARLLAALSHPNIVTLFAIEESQGNRFLVMELVEGQPLERHLPPKGMELEALLAIAEPLTAAVAAAHEQGILHRDLKPNNIMIGADGRLKVLDFGLAEPARQTERGEQDEQGGSRADSASGDSTLLETVTHLARHGAGTVAGTVPYLAPERLEGKPGDHRADLFALGVLLYQLATGRRPFEADNTVELMVSILRDEPTWPGEVRTDIPDALSAIILRSLAKDPEKRHGNARELLDELRSLRAATTTHTELSLGALTLAHLRRRRRKGLYGAAVLALVLLFGAYGLGQHLSDPQSAAVSTEQQKRAIAVMPFENLGPAEDGFFADGVSEEITSRLAAVSSLVVISRSSTRHYVGSNMAPEQIAEELGVEYLLEGSVRWSRAEDGASRVRITPTLIGLGETTEVLWSESYDRVLEDIFAVQSEIAEQVTDQLDITLFPRERMAIEERPTEDMEAYQAYLEAVNQSERTNDPLALEGAIRYLDRAVGLDPDFVEAWAALAWNHAQLYHFGHDRTPSRAAEADRTIAHALEIGPGSAEVRLNHGYVLYWIHRDYEGALRRFREAADLIPSDSRPAEAQGYILRRQGRFDACLERLYHAAEIDPRNTQMQREIANTLVYLRRYSEALPIYDRAIGLTSDPGLAYLYKARAQWLMGDLDGARRTLGAMPPTSDPLRTWFRIWQTLYEGRYDEALRLLDREPASSFQWTSFYWPRPLLEARIRGFAGDDETTTHPLYERALSLVDALLEASPDDARLVAARAEALAGLGRRDAALEAAERSLRLHPLEEDAVIGMSYRLTQAAIRVSLDQPERAVAELDFMLSRPSMLSTDLLRTDPRWRPLAGRTDFEALLLAHP